MVSAFFVDLWALFDFELAVFGAASNLAAVVSRARAARPDDATDEERARLDAAVRDDE